MIPIRPLLQTLRINSFFIAPKFRRFLSPFSTADVPEYNKQCPGCGAKFQQDMPLKPGFLPSIKIPIASQEEIESIRNSKEPLLPSQVKLLIEADKPRIIVCKRCHELKHQHAHIPVQSLKTNKLLFKDLKLDRGLVIMVVDAFDAPGSLIHDIDITGLKPLVLINKSDLVPPDLLPKIKWHIKKYYPKTEEIVPISAKTGFNIHVVMKWIKSARDKGKNVYLVGCTNVGKSKLTNYLVEKSGGRGAITTSHVAGTTVSFIQIPTSSLSLELDDSDKKNIRKSDQNITKETYIYDTPGIFNPSQLNLMLLDKKELWYTNPVRLLKPRQKSLITGYSYFIGGMVQIDAFSDIEINLFSSTRLKVFQCQTSNAELFYKTNVGTKLVPPIKDCSLRYIPALVGKEIEVYENTIIFLSGIGWLHFKSKGYLTVKTPRGAGVEVFYDK